MHATVGLQSIRSNIIWHWQVLNVPKKETYWSSGSKLANGSSGFVQIEPVFALYLENIFFQKSNYPRLD